MGDGITTTFDLFMFLLIFGGIPLLVIALPLAILGIAGFRRYNSVRVKREPPGNP